MKKFGLTGNQLKVLALIAMTVDHIGMLLLPGLLILRIIGRLAFPIFAYMIAEGCRHTRSMLRYGGMMAALALGCQLVTYVAAGSLYQCILVTFSMSVLVVGLLQNALDKKTAPAWLGAASALVLVYFVTRVIPKLLSGTDYHVDYGFWGVLLPVALYFAKDRMTGLCFCAGLLVLISGSNRIQYYSLLALPLLAFYNGQRGKLRMKYLFYIYYPAHLAVLHLIAYFGLR